MNTIFDAASITLVLAAAASYPVVAVGAVQFARADMGRLPGVMRLGLALAVAMAPLVVAVAGAIVLVGWVDDAVFDRPGVGS